MINDSIDERSKKKAYTLFDHQVVSGDEIGKTIGLQKIHAYIFANLYDFAGQIRTKTISKGGFVFANGDFLPGILRNIERQPERTFNQIVEKYIEMNIAHPFMEGNGRATRIWLDLIFKKNLGQCVDWSKIEKKDYLDAMVASPTNPKPIFNLLNSALTDDINNRELFLKGIDYSYYYEEED